MTDDPATPLHDAPAVEICCTAEPCSNGRRSSLAAAPLAATEEKTILEKTEERYRVYRESVRLVDGEEELERLQVTTTTAASACEAVAA